MEIDFKGRTYATRAFEETTALDYLRIARHIEFAIDHPKELSSAIRGCIAVMVPSAIRDLRAWDDPTAFRFFGLLVSPAAALEMRELAHRQLAHLQCRGRADQ